MQFIEIYIKEKLVGRFPLGLTDLMGIKSDCWEVDAMDRGKLINLMLGNFSTEPLISQIRARLKPKIYLVVESRMNGDDEKEKLVQ